MRRFRPLFTTPKSPSPPPKATPKSSTPSDALWNLYKHLLDIDIDSPRNSSTTSDHSGGGGGSGVYYTSNTILDLDAADSPAARPYTAADHEAQIAKWGTNHALEALVKRMHGFRDEISHAKLAWRRKLGPFDERTVTERDVLVMALLGPFDGGGSTRGGENGNGNGQLSYEFLERIGIFRRIVRGDGDGNDIPLTVRYLAHRVKTQRTQGQGQGRDQLPIDTQTESPPSDDQLTKPKPQDTNDDASTGTRRRRPDATTVHQQQGEKKKTKTKTKAQQLKHLKSVLRKFQSDARSIQRILYPLLNDDHGGRALIAECHEEILLAMTAKTKPTQSTTPGNHKEAQTQTQTQAEPESESESESGARENQHNHEQEQDEATTRAAIFIKNLAYNLVRVRATKGKGDLSLSPDLKSIWSRVLDYTDESTPLTTDSAATESPRPSTGNIAPDVDMDVPVERASSRWAAAGFTPITPEPEPERQGPVLA